MISIDNLFDKIFENNIELALLGELELSDESIKWVYDGLANFTNNIDKHLEDVFESDKEIIEDFLLENNLTEDFYFCLPEINDTIISFYIYEKHIF